MSEEGQRKAALAQGTVGGGGAAEEKIGLYGGHIGKHCIHNSLSNFLNGNWRESRSFFNFL